MTEQSDEVDVLIAGAGPTGLLLAVELQRRGISNLLIDAHDAPLGWDRATVVHPRSLEIFESLGLVDRFLAAGVKVKGARFRSDGEVLGVLDFSKNGSRYGFDIGISEDATERIVTDELERLRGGVTRSTRLISMDAGEDGVVATIERDGSRSEVRASWLVGCDGMHSTVRGLAGIAFEGEDIAAPWAVFDVTLEGWDDDYDFNAGHFEAARPVILTPLPGRRWRAYLQPSSETSDLEADALEVLERYTPGIRLADVENAGRFRCHSRLAERFRSGRILLAGDAAHACSPTEGHGMNTGLQDAFNLGWKLAHVCRGESLPGLLDSYEAERRPVAQTVVGSGAEAEAGQAMKTSPERAERDAEIARAMADADEVHSEAAALAELDRSYAGSPIVSAGAGDRLLDPFHESMHRHCHTVFSIGGDVADADAASPFVGAVVPLDADDAAAAGLIGAGPPAVLAVRPDRYVGFRGEPGGLSAYLEALAA